MDIISFISKMTLPFTIARNIKELEDYCTKNDIPVFNGINTTLTEFSNFKVGRDDLFEFLKSTSNEINLLLLFCEHNVKNGETFFQVPDRPIITSTGEQYDLKGIYNNIAQKFKSKFAHKFKDEEKPEEFINKLIYNLYDSYISKVPKFKDIRDQFRSKKTNRLILNFDYRMSAQLKEIIGILENNNKEKPLDYEVIKQDAKKYLSWIRDTYGKLSLPLKMRKDIPLNDIYISVKTMKWKENDYEDKRRQEMEWLKGELKEERAIIYSNPMAMKEKEEEKKVFLWEEKRKTFKQGVILGDPGKGKSTLLKWEACKIANESLKKLDEGKNIEDLEFPIFIPLTGISTCFGDKPGDILGSLVVKNLKDCHYSDDFINFIKSRAEKGKLCFLLDALDEVPIQSRNGVKGSIQNLKTACSDINNKCRCRFLLTSRIVGYDSCPLHENEDNCLCLVPFGKKEVEQFSKAWFGKYNENGKGFIKKVKSNVQIKGLAQNPLLLTLLCGLYDRSDNNSLPKNRAQLYENCIKDFLGSWRKTKEADFNKFRARKKRLLYESIAIKFFEEERDIFSGDDFIDLVNEIFDNCPRLSQLENTNPSKGIIEEITQDDGIIIKAGEDKYMFLHRTFHEYLAACYLSEREDCIDVIEKNLWNWEWWEEVILLLSSLLGEKVDNLVNMLLKHDDPRPPKKWIEEGTCEDKDFLRQMLFLSARCCGQGTVGGEVLNKVLNMLKSILNDDKYSIFHEDSVIALGDTNSNEAVSILREVLENNKYIKDVRRRAAEALGKIDSPEAVKALIKALGKDEDSEVRLAASEALGEIGSLEAVSALIEAFREGKQDYICFAIARSLVNIGSIEIIDYFLELLRNDGSALSMITIKFLDNIDSFQILYQIIEVLKDDNCNRYLPLMAAKILSNAGHQEGLKYFINLLDKGNLLMQMKSIKILGDIGSCESLPYLIKLKGDIFMGYITEALQKIDYCNSLPLLIKILYSKDEDFDLRWNAAIVIGKSGYSGSVGYLKEALKNDDPDVRMMVSDALGEINTSEVISILRDTLNDRNFKVSLMAAYSLAKIGCPEALPFLIEALEHENLRLSAINLLGKLGSSKALPILKDVLNDKNPFIRKYAAIALGEIGSSGAVERLIEVLIKDCNIVNWAAAESLGKIGSQESIPYLLRALKEGDDYLIKHVVKALSKLASFLTISQILEILDSSYNDARLEAAKILGRVCCSQAISYLAKLLDDDCYEVSHTAVVSLRDICIKSDYPKEIILTLINNLISNNRRLDKVIYHQLKIISREMRKEFKVISHFCI